jgi:hypothetical protein
MTSVSWLKLGCLGFLTALFIAVSGCGGGKAERAKVKGHVKFFDKDLTAGTVAFTSKDGSHVGSTTIDMNGNYEISDAPVGDVIITVKAPTMMKGGMLKDKAKPPAGVPEMKGPGGDDTSFVPSSIDPSKIVQIPGKYGSVETSGLTYTVVKGEQTKDIVLSP